jgi:hypothetical protein
MSVSPAFNKITDNYARQVTGAASEAYIPDAIVRGLTNYRDFHLPVGGFLYYVLTNDLKEAVNAADPHSLYALPAVVKYVYTKFPSQIVGSPEKYYMWTIQEVEATGDLTNGP